MSKNKIQKLPVLVDNKVYGLITLRDMLDRTNETFKKNRLIFVKLCYHYLSKTHKQLLILNIMFCANPYHEKISYLIMNYKITISESFVGFIFNPNDQNSNKA